MVSKQERWRFTNSVIAAYNGGADEVQNSVGAKVVCPLDRFSF
jgi:hypothetical protein